MNFTTMIDFHFWVPLTVKNTKTTIIKGHSEDGYFKAESMEIQHKIFRGNSHHSLVTMFFHLPPQENLASDSPPFSQWLNRKKSRKQTGWSTKMVSGQNLELIAPHLLACTHLSLDWCQRLQDPQSFNPRLAPVDIRARQVSLICYHLESVVFRVNQLRLKETYW